MAVQFPPAVQEFLRRPLFASMVTLNQDGSPHLTYMWYEFDGRAFTISTLETRQKWRNLQRDPRLTLGLLDPDNPYRYVTVRGKAVLSREGANELIQRLAHRYMGPEKGPQYARELQDPARGVVNLEPYDIHIHGF